MMFDVLRTCKICHMLEIDFLFHSIHFQFDVNVDIDEYAYDESGKESNSSCDRIDGEFLNFSSIYIKVNGTFYGVTVVAKFAKANVTSRQNCKNEC